MRYRAGLTASIDAKASEMSDVISNVLDLMRFEAGESSCDGNGRRSMIWSDGS